MKREIPSFVSSKNWIWTKNAYGAKLIRYNFHWLSFLGWKKKCESKYFLVIRVCINNWVKIILNFFSSAKIECILFMSSYFQFSSKEIGQILIACNINNCINYNILNWIWLRFKNVILYVWNLNEYKYFCIILFCLIFFS